MQLPRVFHLLSISRFLMCKALFRRPWRAFLRFGFLGNRSFSVTLKSGRRATFSKAGRDDRLWDWILAGRIPVEFTETGLVELRWAERTILLRPGTQDFFIFREIFIDDVYGIRSICRTLDTVIDLGANAGFFSCALVGKARRVIAVEPVGENHCHAQMMVARNGGNPEDILRLAVSDETGRLLRIHHDERNSGGHSIVPERVEGVSGGFEIAKSTSLADVIAAAGETTIDLLKCDVKGAEYATFLAASAVVLGRIRRIVMEVHVSSAHPPSELQKLVAHLGRSGFEVELDGRIPETTEECGLMLTATREATVVKQAA